MIPLLHEYDSSATNPDNLIVDELHILSEATASTIVSQYGLFYSRSVIVKNRSNNEPLIFGTDYFFSGFDPEITALTALECHAAITFKNLSIPEVLVTYQCVGGSEGENSYLVAQIRDKIFSIVETDVPWDLVQNKPQQYPPIAHTHEVLTDLDGIESLTHTVENILEALINNRGPVNSALRISDRIDRLLAIIVKFRLDLNRLSVTAVNRASTVIFGIDRLATLQEVLDGLLHTTIVTPWTLQKKIEAHENELNPHPQYLTETDIVISLNKKVISENYTFRSGYDGESIGDVIVLDNVDVIVPDDSDWYIGTAIEKYR